MTAAETAHTPGDGGPAFGHGDHVNGGYPGMSIRDYFAGQTLPYLAEFHGQFLYRDTGPHDIAQKAYEIADAMLAERSKATGGAS